MFKIWRIKRPGIKAQLFWHRIFLSGNQPRAIICYELACTVLPNDKSITENLERARPYWVNNRLKVE